MNFSSVSDATKARSESSRRKQFNPRFDFRLTDTNEVSNVESVKLIKVT